MRINALITLTILLLTTRYTHSQNHPEFAQNEYTQDIFEDADIGDVVLTVVATDVDSHGITFSIEGESHSLFTLNSDTGVITVNNELDRESQDLIQFDVRIRNLFGYVLVIQSKSGLFATLIMQKFAILMCFP